MGIDVERAQPLPPDVAAETLDVAVSREVNARDLLRRPEVDYAALMRVPSLGPGVADPTVAEQVKESGVARSLDPMPSADRKVLHDALAEIGRDHDVTSLESAGEGALEFALADGGIKVALADPDPGATARRASAMSCACSGTSRPFRVLRSWRRCSGCP